jgi:MFS transporter, PPP family, 3-phenylpropionic acid transporter
MILWRDPLFRFVVLYSALFGAFGFASPFLPAFLASRGLAPEALGLALGAATAVRLISGTIAGRLADRLAAFRAELMICSLLAAAATLAYLPVYGFWAVAALTLLHAAALAPLVPLADALSLANADPARNPVGKGFEYGWVRGAGSAAFIVGAIVAGYVVSRYELSAIIWLSAMGLLAAAICALLVPAFPQEPATATATTHSPARAWLMLLRQRAFVYLTVVAALVLGSHALHDSFAVIRWTAAGISPATTGVLWAVSVAAEVVVFFFIGPRLLRVLGPTGALALAAAAGVLRWVVMALTAEVVILAMVQPLHGFTFALLHLACMRLIAATVPPAVAGTAQAVYGLIGIGGTTAFLTVFSGWLYGRFGPAGFWAMAFLCSLAFPVIRLLQNALAAPDAGAR